LNYIAVRKLNHRSTQELLKELNSCYGDNAYHSEVHWLSKGKVLDRVYELRHEIKLFLREHGTSQAEVDNSNWWLKVAFLKDITDMLNDVQMHLQGEHKMITETASTEYSSARKIKMCVEESEIKNLSSTIRCIY
jgi:hypothetical protein